MDSVDEDWYVLLGVTSNASDEEIKKAYRQKALEFHPDRNQSDSNAEVIFKKISEAYNVLKDPERRRSYDRRKASTSFFGSFVTPPKSQDVVNVVNNIIDETVFDKLDQVLGRTPKKRNLETKISITLEELYSGTDKAIVFKRNEKCDTCKGRGAVTREDFKLCDSCYGLGHAPKLSTLWKKSSKSKCYKCRGSGKLIINKCVGCKGDGLCKKEIELVIPIPKGLNLKDRLVVPEEGEGGGDLLIQVDTKPHKFFDVSGNDLVAEVPISFYQAILGDYLEIETLKGTAYFKVEAGTQNNDIVILKNYGLKIGDNYGDLLIKLLIDIPRFISTEQKDLLEKFKQSDKKSATKPKTRAID